jgi:hypothetical protein
MKKKILIALLAIGGAAAGAHAAAMMVNGPAAQKMWEALSMMAKLENLPLNVISGNSDTIEVRNLTCASEMYDACSMFVKVNGAEKMLVHTAAAAQIIEALYENGIYPVQDDASASQSVAFVSCSKTGAAYDCVIKEQPRTR